MKAQIAFRLLLLIAAILSTSHQAVAQHGLKDMTLRKFSDELHKIANTAIDFRGLIPEKTSSLQRAVLVDPTLAKYPSIRSNAASILSDVQVLRSLNVQLQEELRAIKERAKVFGLTNEIDPRSSSKLPDSPWAKEDKIRKTYRNKLAPVSDNIRKRLKTIENQIETPLGQQFLLPANSPVVALLSNGHPTVPHTPFDQNFEVISIVDGGFLAYLQNVVYPHVGNRELTVSSDRSKMVLVRGYKKPLAPGELLIIRVKLGELVTIRGMHLLEYVVQE